jgi:hypothetical protein
MKRLGRLLRDVAPLILVVGLLLPGWAGPPPAAAATPCPTGPITIKDLIRLAGDRGPLLDRYPPAVAGIYERALACLGTRTLRFKAYVADPGGVGGTSAYGVAPRWMLDAGVFLFGTFRRVDGFVDGGFVMAAVPPRLGNVRARFKDRWVLVGGRFGDAVARSCRATGAAGVTPSPAETVRICRSVLVISSIEPLAAPPTTTATGPVLAETPSSAAAPSSGIQPWRVVGWMLLAVTLGMALAIWLGERRRRVEPGVPAARRDPAATSSPLDPSHRRSSRRRAR